MDERVVVVGAGPAGLAAAWAIRRVGIDPLIAEKAGVVAASWRARHDQLRLNTHRMFSHQPGVRIPRRYGPFPARDEYVAYLERYAAGLRIRFGAAVSRIDRAGPGWQLDLGEGSLSTAQVVVATGPDAEPIMPSWPGMASCPRFEGPEVCFADGSACAPDVVICATGYRPSLAPLVGAPSGTG